MPNYKHKRNKTSLAFDGNAYSALGSQACAFRTQVISSVSFSMFL